MKQKLILLIVLVLLLTGCSNKNDSDNDKGGEQVASGTAPEIVATKEFELHDMTEAVELRWIDQRSFREVRREIAVQLKKVSFDGNKLAFHTEIKNGYGGTVKLAFDGLQRVETDMGGDRTERYSLTRFGETIIIPNFAHTNKPEEVIIEFESDRTNYKDLEETEILIDLVLAFQVEGFEFDNTSVTFQIKLNGEDGYTDEVLPEEPTGQES